AAHRSATNDRRDTVQPARRSHHVDLVDALEWSRCASRFHRHCSRRSSRRRSPMRTLTRFVVPCIAIVAASIGATRSAVAQSSPPHGGASVLLAGSPRTDKPADPAGTFADSIEAATRDFKTTGVARTINE